MYTKINVAISLFIEIIQMVYGKYKVFKVIQSAQAVQWKPGIYV